MANNRVRWVRLGNDLDRPIHRIFLASRFEELVQSRETVLVDPALWIDLERIPVPTSC